MVNNSNDSNYKAKKGKEGEDFVYNAILNAIAKIRNNKKEVYFKVFRNCIIAVPSVYGLEGIRYTEIDILVMGTNALFVFEVKNQNIDYAESNKKKIVLNDRNKTETSNPVEQNHTHKKTLAKLLQIDMSNIITIECVLDADLQKLKYNNYQNDYVLTIKDNLEYSIGRILSAQNQLPNHSELFNTIEQHYKNNRNKIEFVVSSGNKYWKIKDFLSSKNLSAFNINDVIMCPNCNGNGILYFLDDISSSNPPQYYMICSHCGRKFKLLNDDCPLVEIISLQKHLKTDEKKDSKVSSKEKFIKTKYSKFYNSEEIKSDTDFIFRRVFTDPLKDLLDNLDDEYELNNSINLTDIHSAKDIIKLVELIMYERSKSKLVKKAIEHEVEFTEEEFKKLEFKISARSYKELGNYLGYDLSDLSFDTHNTQWKDFYADYLTWEPETQLRRVHNLQSCGGAYELITAIINMLDSDAGLILYHKAVELGHGDAIYDNFKIHEREKKLVSILGDDGNVAKTNFNILANLIQSEQKKLIVKRTLKRIKLIVLKILKLIFPLGILTVIYHCIKL